MKPNFLHWLFAVLAGIASWEFVKTPFCNDVAIFQGVAFIADRYYQFPQSVDISWEAKPIGNRLINYLLLKATELFVPFNEQVAFAIVAKILVLLAVFLLAGYFAYIIKGEYTFWIVFFSFVTCLNFCAMQAEYYAAGLSLLAIALMVSQNKYAQVFAGFLIFFIAMIKGITFFLFIPILCGAYLLDKRSQNAIVNVLVGFCSMGVLVIITQLTIWKNMLPDLLLAPVITGVGRWPVTDTIQIFIIQSFITLYYIPVLAVAAMGIVLLLTSKTFDAKERTAFIAMWIVPAAMILIHSENFAYQFFIYVVPAVVTVVICARKLEALWYRNEKKQLIISSVIPVAIIWMFLALMVLNSWNGIMPGAEGNVYRWQKENAAEINRLYDLPNQSSILYLDAGAAPYYFMANSTSRYICPLPLQRSTPEWNHRGNYAVEQTYQDALDYDGEFIVGDGAFGFEDWVGLRYDDRKELREKLENEYQIVWHDNWVIYKRKHIPNTSS